MQTSLIDSYMLIEPIQGAYQALSQAGLKLINCLF